MFQPVSVDVPDFSYDDIYEYCSCMLLRDLFDLYHAVTQCYDHFFGVSDSLVMCPLWEYIASWYEIICTILTERVYTASCGLQGHMAPGVGRGQRPDKPDGPVPLT